MVRNIGDYIRLYGLDGSSKGFLKEAYNIEIDRVLHDVDILTFSVPALVSLQTEQEVMYRNKRYIVTKVESVRQADGKATLVECSSAFIELNNKTVKKLEFQNLATQAGLERILNGTGWTVGTVETNDGLLHAMSEENQTALWLVREFARVTGYEVEFDTINRRVSYVTAVGSDTDFTFRYRKNIKAIKRTVTLPVATVIYPQGRGGLTIASVNAGREYLEDYSWYTEQGITIDEARRKFRKEYVWKDERFIYAGTLMRAGQEELRKLSRPQIAYETKVADLNAGKLDIGDYATVIDEELGIKLKVRVVKLKQYPGHEWDNEIELNYLIPGLSDSSQDSGSTSVSGGEQMVLVKNQTAATLNSSYQNLLQLSLTAYVSTNLQAGLLLIGQASTSTVLRAYLTFNGARIGPEIKQAVNGFATIGVPLLLAQIPEGSGFLNLYVKVDAGTFTIAIDEASLFIKGENLFGGMSATLPKADIVEEVAFTPMGVPEYKFTELKVPIPTSYSENVSFVSLIVTETLKIDFKS
ncbi:phage tail protein [Brevibacillus agri]|uniref:phage tail protein n=1 Tax=Brevibacillus TaxID=55080 RepID=UPI000271BB8C|nr:MULTISPECIES: phage tail protein [Brevibacillus]EJL44031.1 phage minor structural protein [Brevibacillus sp. CF112]MED1642293.1 phage tail protein [Brevibacillus agri]MED1657726.1 phage tail protein [Brevibacillus agri]MED1689483.1 phage tail protein [Brevibacillus agri]MED1694283.1 phage tail protein [Brevibacillus agri]